MLNLVINTLSWSRGMLSMNNKSHMIRHVLKLQIFSTTKKLHFWQNHEEVLNQLNSMGWVGCLKIAGSGPMQTSYIKVTCRGHMNYLEQSAFTNRRNFNNTDSSRVKLSCQLVVRLKANKCYYQLLGYLSSYTNFLNIKLFLGSLVLL